MLPLRPDGVERRTHDYKRNGTLSLFAALERFTRDWNTGATPFTWVNTADEILAKAVRKPQADSGAGH